MDSLRPDRDEVDSFQQSRNPRANKKVTKNKTRARSDRTSSKSGIGGKVDPGVNASKQIGEAGSIAIVQPARNTLFGLIIVAFIVGAAGVGWVYNDQRQELNALKTELKEALGFIRQSKLLMARFEGKLSETDAEMNEGDTEAQKKLKFLDSEVRKLWGVAYDRNRKAIGANDGVLKQHASELKSMASVNKKQTAALSDLVKKISLQQSLAQVVQSDLLTVKGSNEQLSSQIKQVEDASSAALLGIRQEINRLAENGDVEVRVQQNEMAIEAIDASRLQLNERFIALDRKLNDLQLSIKSLQSGGKK